MSQQFFIIEARANSNYKRRRRCCEKCDYRATTYEVSKEDFDLIRDIIRKREDKKRRDKFKALAVKQANAKICCNCKHWTNFRCGFEFPDAGGIFAEECSLYERVKD